jgi:polyhydroxyalkanoate synthesis repressor PhaR
MMGIESEHCSFSAGDAGRGKHTKQAHRFAPIAHCTGCGAAASTTGTGSMATIKKSAERLIKKYPNRRLYDTQTSTYITLADVKQLVMDTEDFKVVDAKSGEDLTRSILLQIILEEESGGVPMFSSVMLSQIIRYYGHAMQGMMGTYLEKNIQAFIDIQNKLAENSKDLYSGNALNPDMWAQFMNMQGPMMQGMMGNYIEQSKNLFMQMQEQMQSQAKSMFGTFPFNQPDKK